MFDFNAARKRSELLMNIRGYFIGKDYLEVYTPSLAPALIPEPSIKVFETEFINEFTGSLPLYLIPSPEVFMKKLLAAGSGSIFQICQSFRNAEQLGAIHNPEFTMLEYYTVGCSDKDSIPLTIEMIEHTAVEKRSWMKNQIILSMEEAMWEYASTDMHKVQTSEAIQERARELGLHPDEGEAWDDTFNRIFLTFTEPSLPMDAEVYLTDYPDGIRCLAKKGRNGTRQRWEMYINGIETANCYTEETDKDETASYFAEEEAELIRGREGTADAIPIADKDFPSLDIPESSGVAMGLDRLLAAELGLKTIEPLLLFPLSDMLSH